MDNAQGKVLHVLRHLQFVMFATVRHCSVPLEN